MGHLSFLIERYPALAAVEKPLAHACDILEECFRNGGKLLLCGNGGSAFAAGQAVGSDLDLDGAGLCPATHVEQ